jgi:hypothetical protein
MKLKANNEIRLTANEVNDRGVITKPGQTIKAGDVFETDDETSAGLIACGAAFEPSVNELKADDAAAKAAEKAEASAKK